MIRTAVIASTPMTRAGLQAMLHSEQIEVVASAATPDELDLTGIEALVATSEQDAEAIALSMQDPRAIALVVLAQSEEKAISVLSRYSWHGWSIISPAASAEQLQAAIVAAVQGLITCSPQLAGWLVKGAEAASEATSLKPVNSINVSETLTPREREVLELVGQGLSNKLIARSLRISDHTVKFHISSISAKLGASSRTEAVRLGLRNGLITL